MIWFVYALTPIYWTVIAAVSLVYWKASKRWTNNAKYVSLTFGSIAALLSGVWWVDSAVLGSFTRKA